MATAIRANGKSIILSAKYIWLIAPSPTKEANNIEIKIFNWTIPEPSKEYRNLPKNFLSSLDNIFILFKPIPQNIFIVPKLINKRINWVKPAIIIDQASAKWELDLNDTKVTIIKMLRITDRKEGKKNLPFTFKTELNTDDRVTNIKKGKVIINNWFFSRTQPKCKIKIKPEEKF